MYFRILGSQESGWVDYMVEPLATQQLWVSPPAQQKEKRNNAEEINKWFHGESMVKEAYA